MMDTQAAYKGKKKNEIEVPMKRTLAATFALDEWLCVSEYLFEKQGA